MPRKPHKYHYIYKITCIVTGNYYIGMHSTSNLNDGYSGGGTRLGNSKRKYGKDTHIKEILEFLNDRESLAKREAEIVNEQFLQDPACMNLIVGGNGGGSMTGKHHSEQSKKQISDSNKGKPKQPFTEERKLKLSESMKGKTVGNKSRTGLSNSEESKRKASASMIGKNKGKPKPVVICPHCKKEGGSSVMKRYHFSRCKHLTDVDI